LIERIESIYISIFTFKYIIKLNYPIQLSKTILIPLNYNLPIKETLLY